MEEQGDLPGALLIREILEHRQGLLRGLQVLAFRALELLVILHVVVGVGDELRQLVGLAAGGAAEGGAIGEGDRLRCLRLGALLGTLHEDLLGWPARPTSPAATTRPTIPKTIRFMRSPFFSLWRTAVMGGRRGRPLLGLLER